MKVGLWLYYRKHTVHLFNSIQFIQYYLYSAKSQYNYLKTLEIQLV